jgi:hypothetical protein
MGQRECVIKDEFSSQRWKMFEGFVTYVGGVGG